MSDHQIFLEQEKPSRVEGMSKQLGFDIPVELVRIPSQGKLYPPEHPLANEEGVEVRSMTAREEDILTSPALHKNGTMISKLIESCLINKSIKVGTLLRGDRDALMIAVRIIGYGSDYKVKMPCPLCEEMFDNVFELNRLPVKECPVKSVQDGTNRFAYTLPLSKMPVEFKLLTCEDERDISQQAERKKKLGVAQSDSRITTRLFHQVLSINGVEDRGKLATMVSSLRAGDSMALRSCMVKAEPGVDMRQEASCPHCGGVSEVDVPLVASFFWPEFD